MGVWSGEHGDPTEEIWQRVEESLRAVGMYEYRKYSPNKLSGGQKQRVSIAGVLAMHPKCIVLDEPTAMLDPVDVRKSSVQSWIESGGRCYADPDHPLYGRDYSCGQGICHG